MVLPEILKTRVIEHWSQILWCSLLTGLVLNLGYFLWPQPPKAITIQPDPRILVGPEHPYLVETTPESAKSYALLSLEQTDTKGTPKRIASVNRSTLKSGSKADFKGWVYLNSATSLQLQQLQGIGPKTAANILTFRNQHGPFHSVEQLLDVPGIGPKTLDKIRSHCKL